MREATKVLATAAGTAAALEAARRIMRTPVLTWGATDEEVARKLPGDDLLADAAVVSTRAITVDAPPAAVWPWFVQMGAAAVAPIRTTGSRTSSAWRSTARTRSTRVRGPRRRRRDPGRRASRTCGVEVLEPDRALVLRSTDGTWVWAFVLDDSTAGPGC